MFPGVGAQTSFTIISDAEIGFDVGDVLALAFMLKCFLIDENLITACAGDATCSAQSVAEESVLIRMSQLMWHTVVK
jgi:inosine-uridine nucleoside N-ribohydrolase